MPALPARAEHFASYVELGRTLPGALYLRLSSVSMYLSREHLHRARTEHGLPPEDVELDLRRDRNITYAITNTKTGHIEVWAPPDVLLPCLVDG